MVFRLDKFIRHTPPRALKSYFDARLIELGSSIDWTKDEQELARGVRDAVERLPAAVREQVYADFERAEELTDEVGEQAMLCAFPDRQAAIERLEGLEGPHERSLWLLLNDETTFRRAEEIRFSDYHRRTRQWDGFIGPQGQTVVRTDDAVSAFKAELQHLFRGMDGSGRAIKVDIFERCPTTDCESEQDRDDLVQVTVYLEGMPRGQDEFGSDGEVIWRVQRPAIEVALTHSPRTGAIDVIAKGGKPAREKVARIFLKTLLGAESRQMERVPIRQIELSSLAAPRDFDTDAEDGIASVQVNQLGLREYGGGRGGILFKGPPRRPGFSPYAFAERRFGKRSPLRGGFTVEFAKLIIEFYPEPGATQGENLNVELAAPHRCNLKDRTQHQRLIGEKYLPRWGLMKVL